MTLDPRVSRWLQSRRGIRPETAEAFGLYTDGTDLVIPYGEHEKRRWSKNEDNPFGLEKEGRVFTWSSTGIAGQIPYLPPDFAQRERMILVEGETDTMALWQALPDSLRGEVSVVGLSGLNAWKERYAEELFAEAKRVFVVIDNDDPYTAPDAHKAGEKAWTQIRTDLGRKARRVRLPQGTNDLCDFFQAYDWYAFEAILKAAAEPRRHYKRLDLSKPPPPTDWLIEGLIERGAVTLLAGDAGVGKSLIVAAMALAVAEDTEETFLGLPVKRHGRVIMVDEENAADLVAQRLNALTAPEPTAPPEGDYLRPVTLTPQQLERIEYLSFAGVDMLNEPTLLLEEALDLEPELVVIDSQGAVSVGAEENSNTEMTALFKHAFRPLARESGAAVVLLHHTPKDGSGRPRGAGAIKSQADQALSITEAVSGDIETGTLNIFPSKPRRQMSTVHARIVGELEADGYLRVIAPEEAF
ncbi:MAG: AAA family ATPase [Dehalococcoidia bacterium]|nr:AAA family ATPase [Dehalococcoidia bacterium]